MKISKLVFSLTLTQLSVASFVSAQETPKIDFNQLTPVTETSMKLVGKGVRDRSTDENIVLTCVDQACEQLRFVYFNASKEAFYLSRSFKIKLREDQVNDEQALQEFAKDFGKISRALKNQNVSWEKRTFRGMFIYGGAVIGGITVGVTGGAVLGASLFLGAGISAATISAIKGPDNLDKFDFITPLFQSTYGAFNPSHSSQLSKAEGWNWSSKPKAVTHSAFQWIAVAAKDADLLSNQAETNHVSYDAYPEVANGEMTKDWSRVHDFENRGMKIDSIGKAVAILDKMEAEFEARGLKLMLDPNPKRKRSIYKIDSQFMAEYIVKNNTSLEAYFNPMKERAIHYWEFFDSLTYDMPAIKGLPKYKEYKQRAWAYNSIYFSNLR
jgi:hypothetical protein